MSNPFDITKGEALAYWRDSICPEYAYDLFSYAAQVRRAYLGGRPWLSAGSDSLFPCSVTPPCGYCAAYAQVSIPRKALWGGLEKLEQLGYRYFSMSGGTDLSGGLEAELLDMLREARQHAGLRIAVNLGPSFSKEALVEMQALGVESVIASLECAEPGVFRAAKPGDSLEKRLALLDACEEAAMPLRSAMLIGLGESMEDRIDHLLFLRKFYQLYQLRISRFQPFGGTAYGDRSRCSAWEMALTVALARFILPDQEISLGPGSEEDDIPLWYLAGGGNQITAAYITATPPEPRPGVDIYDVGGGAYVVDSRKSKERILESMGFGDVGFLPIHRCDKGE